MPRTVQGRGLHSLTGSTRSPCTSCTETRCEHANTHALVVQVGTTQCMHARYHAMHGLLLGCMHGQTLQCMDKPTGTGLQAPDTVLSFDTPSTPSPLFTSGLYPANALHGAHQTAITAIHIGHSLPHVGSCPVWRQASQRWHSC